MGITNVISLLSGVALFLFGMGLMGDGLKQAAGNKMELILYKLSSTPLKGVILGTVVTAVIQSSAATSVMVVGFVNTAIMSLTQAISVVLGAILGTSVTGWIIALSELGGDATGILALFSTSTLTGIIAIVGIVMRMTTKKAQKKHISSVMLGFAVLMFGISAMSGAVAPLKQSEKFVAILTSFSNPFIGIAIGIIATSILQSASSAVGLLQTLAIIGVIDFQIAFPMLLGINIGASVPVLLASIGAKANAKRAAYAYLLETALGSIIIAIIFYLIDSFVHFGFMSNIVDSFGIAFINSAFRLVLVIILFPFVGAMSKLLTKMIKDDYVDEDSVIPPLEERFLANPELALTSCSDAIVQMTKVVGKNLNNAFALMFDFSEDGFNRIVDSEDVVDKFEDKLGAYLIKITAQGINKEQSKTAAKYLHAIGDLERISDHSQNLAEVAQEIHEKKIQFSDAGRKEVDTLINALSEVMGLAFDSFIHNDLNTALRVEPLEEVIDHLCDEMKLNHIDRLQKGVCTILQGYVYNDILNNAERVSDHCSNIALSVIESYKDEFDAHEYVNQLAENKEASFEEYYIKYSEKYNLKREQS